MLNHSLSHPHRLDLDTSAQLPMVLDPRLYLYPCPSPHLGLTPTHRSPLSRELRATSSRLSDRRYVPLEAILGSRVDLGLMEIPDSAGSRSAASTAPPVHGEPAVRTLVADCNFFKSYDNLHADNSVTISRSLANARLRLASFLAITPHLSCLEPQNHLALSSNH